MRTAATRSEAWAHVGHNMVALYPASTITYDVVYLRETTTINSSDDAFKLPENVKAIGMEAIAQIKEGKIKVLE